ncbi:MAG: hypothetical protein BGO69_14605 [Bacteroidetes bacterium 46-16]|nr:MAG: hypothetical protein BGO69_14605 [Bacteroidetes bacterium 46-16]
MENKLLQSILQAGLLDIGDSDERLENIVKSIADLDAKLKKEQHLLPAYTLVAMDPNIGSDEPVLVEVETIISNHWKALRAKFSETPIPIIRAVILHALYNTGMSDPKIARIIYLSGSNFYPFAKLSREREVVEKIISDLGELAEENASEEWSLSSEPQSLKLGVIKINGLKFGDISLDTDSLTSGLKTAAQPDPATGHGPQHGNANWQNHFSNTASSAISNAINMVISELTSSLSSESLETPINKFFGDFKKSLDQALKSSFNSIQAVERRSKLLWWKETLYSSSLKNSYRSVSNMLQPIIMAEDLYQQLPAVVPVSVDYLLKDTLLLVNNEANKKMKFSTFLKEVSKPENIAIAKEYFGDRDVLNRRVPITDFIALLCHEKVEASMVKKYTGIDETEQVSLADIGVMMFHDLMAEYLIPKSK